MLIVELTAEGAKSKDLLAKEVNLYTRTVGHLGSNLTKEAPKSCLNTL